MNNRRIDAPAFLDIVELFYKSFQLIFKILSKLRRLHSTVRTHLYTNNVFELIEKSTI